MTLARPKTYIKQGQCNQCQTLKVLESCVIVIRNFGAVSFFVPSNFLLQYYFFVVANFWLYVFVCNFFTSHTCYTFFYFYYFLYFFGCIFVLFLLLCTICTLFVLFCTFCTFCSFFVFIFCTFGAFLNLLVWSGLAWSGLHAALESITAALWSILVAACNIIVAV